MILQIGNPSVAFLEVKHVVRMQEGTTEGVLSDIILTHPGPNKIQILKVVLKEKINSSSFRNVYPAMGWEKDTFTIETNYAWTVVSSLDPNCSNFQNRYRRKGPWVRRCR